MATENPSLPLEKTVAEKRTERPHWVLDDAVYSISALLLSVIIIHSIWTLVIRPRAAAVLSQRVVVTNSANVKQQVLQLRSVYVILKDYEQETCVVLMLWSLLLLARQAQDTRLGRKLLDREYVKIGEAQVVLPEDARVYSRPLESLPRDEQSRFLPRLLMVAYNRFGATRSVQDAAEAVRDECDFETASMDTKLSMVRFTAWAIPAVGFVGTVRGIGAALQEAQGAMGGDISGVTMGLGVTFNATLTALVCCIIVMFWMHQLQQFQDRLVLDCRTYVDRQLLRKLRVVSK
ncbi:MAG TPA: MotA/TolQ/ExbB proton channel family protein [Steroidobacteraceae bacterium]|jgi:biopolymer transport protein ExbB/TolQ|nr:MotA/TolQ/ExbB proton channel family protein [Steroidobacteraceae bacterium]